MEVSTMELIFGLVDSGALIAILVLFITGKITTTKSREEYAELIARRMSEEITKGIADAVKQGIVEGILEARNGAPKKE